MSGLQSALEAAGRGSGSIAFLWWAMFAMGTAVFIGVAVMLALALRRRRRSDDAEQRHRDDARATRVVAAAVAATVVVLLVTFTLSLFTSRSAAALASDGAPEIEVTGVQWWWDVRYNDPRPDRVVRSANELHLPAGRPVRIKLASRDVIHSFWVPSLHGKMDLIPGRENMLWIRADRPGTYRGQCAEFCGLQHAKMALFVVVHPPDEYEAWLEGIRAEARPSGDSLSREGERVFLRNACSTCHTVRGTEARGQAGPDLTHFGARLSIAAGEMRNDVGRLAGWLTDPQAVKPGTHMPRVVLAPDELRALLAWLGGLR